jgi:protein phosphatase
MANDDRFGGLNVDGVTNWDGPIGFPPLSSRVRVEFGAHSRGGTRHALNEDHYLVVRLGRSHEVLRTSLPPDAVMTEFEEYGFGMVVADGMNNAGAGEKASRLAIATLSHLVMHFGKWNLRIDDRIAREVMARAERFYRYVDSVLVYESWNGPVPRLRTTLTAAYAAGEDLVVAHVGHSRAYLFHDGDLRLLTHDHTIARRPESVKPAVAPLVDVNATARDVRHILTDAIGMSGPVGPRIEIERFGLADKDRVLLCTNGLTDVIDDHTIATVLASGGSADDQCRALADLATAAGGDDDTTVLEVLLHIPG